MLEEVDCQLLCRTGKSNGQKNLKGNGKKEECNAEYAEKAIAKEMSSTAQM